MKEKNFKNFYFDDEIQNLVDFFEEQQDITMDDLENDFDDYDFGEFTI